MPGPTEKLLGLIVAAGVAVDAGEIGKRGGEGGMLRPERLLLDRQNLLKEPLGLGIAAGVAVDAGEIAKRGGEGGMLRPSVFSRIARTC